MDILEIADAALKNGSARELGLFVEVKHQVLAVNVCDINSSFLRGFIKGLLFPPDAVVKDGKRIGRIWFLPAPAHWPQSSPTT
jgi:hypothetical protein